MPGVCFQGQPGGRARPCLWPTAFAAVAARPRSAPGRPRPRCSAHESPPVPASPGLPHPQELHCSMLDFQRARGKSGELSPSRLRGAGSGYGAAPAGSAPAAARGQMAAGTRGARNAKKGEVGELKPVPGLDFCLLGTGEAQPFPGAPRPRRDRLPHGPGPVLVR